MKQQTIQGGSFLMRIATLIACRKQNPTRLALRSAWLLFDGYRHRCHDPLAGTLTGLLTGTWAGLGR